MKIYKYLEISNTKESIIWWYTTSVLIIGALLLLFFINKELYIFLSEEDNILENLTALFYCIAGLVLFLSAYKEYRNSSSFKNIILTMLLGLFFIFIAGEEISWGQRIFGFDVPEGIKKINEQEEFTIHNLKIFMTYLGIDQHRLLNVFCFLMGVLIPLVYLISQKIQNTLNRIYFPVLPVSCIAIFFLGIVYGQSVAKLYNHWSHTEVKEFIFSIGFLMFSISLLTKKNKF